MTITRRKKPAFKTRFSMKMFVGSMVLLATALLFWGQYRGFASMGRFLPSFLRSDMALFRPDSNFSPVPGQYLSWIYARQNNAFEEAAEITDKLLDEVKSPALIRDGLLDFIKTGQYEKAIELGNLLERKEGFYGSLVYMLESLQFLQEGKTGNAREAAQKIGRFSSLEQFAGPIIMLWVAKADNNNRQLTLTQQEIDTILDENNGPAVLLAHQAYLMIDSGKPDAALQRLPIDSQNNDIVRARAYALSKKGELKKARKELEAHFAFSANSRLLLSDIYEPLLEGQAPEFEQTPLSYIAKGLASLASQFTFDSLELGLLTARLSLYAEAEDNQALVTVARLYSDFGSHDRALDILSQISSRKAFYPYAVIERVNILINTERYDEALDILDDAIKIAPLARTGYVARGRVLSAQEKYAQSTEAFSRVIEIDQKAETQRWDVYYDRGIAHEKNDDWSNAEADFLKSLEINPDNPEVMNYLAYSWIEKGENLDRSLSMLQQAVSERKNEGYIIDSLGWAFYKQANYPSAILWLEKAITLTPQDPVITDHLGDAYWRAGRELEAKFQWQRSLTLEVEDEELEKAIRKKLKSGLPNNSGS